MSRGETVAGITLLAVVPALSLAGRLAAKKIKSLSWVLDDTLLVLALASPERYQWWGELRCES